MNIGKSVVIKGELNGSEDLTIEGQVEGKIELRQNVLTIGPNGKIKAAVFAKSVIVLGEVVGNVTASEKVDIRDNGSVDGDLISPRVAIAEGAHFRGSIDMQRAGSKSESKPAEKPAAQPAPQAQPAAAGQRYREVMQFSPSAVLWFRVQFGFGSRSGSPEPQNQNLRTPELRTQRQNHRTTELQNFETLHTWHFPTS